MGQRLWCPANTKHFYNICTRSVQSSTLVQHCTNAIKMFCACWAVGHCCATVFCCCGVSQNNIWPTSGRVQKCQHTHSGSHNLDSRTRPPTLAQCWASVVGDSAIAGPTSAFSGNNETFSIIPRVCCAGGGGDGRGCWNVGSAKTVKTWYITQYILDQRWGRSQ